MRDTCVVKGCRQLAAMTYMEWRICDKHWADWAERNDWEFREMMEGKAAKKPLSEIIKNGHRRS